MAGEQVIRGGDLASARAVQDVWLLITLAIAVLMVMRGHRLMGLFLMLAVAARQLVIFLKELVPACREFPRFLADDIVPDAGAPEAARTTVRFITR